MQLWICGVRGSTPAPGPEFVRYGGNTSCVAVAHEGEDPRLILDGGTGLQRLTQMLGGRPFPGTMLLGHLHWDHTHGLPFFRSGDHPEARVDLALPSQEGEPEEILARAMSPPHFPIRPRELRGDWTFRELAPGRYDMEGFSVLALEIPHKGGRELGFRVTDGRTTFAYMSDHSPVAAGPGPDGLGEYHETALELASGAELLIHDAQHTAAEFAAVAFLGHSAVEYAIGLAMAASARKVLLFHHDPSRTDDEIDSLVAAHKDGPVEVEAAAEGTIIVL